MRDELGLNPGFLVSAQIQFGDFTFRKTRLFLAQALS